MHKNITRGLAVAALTGGFTILGATAASAIDIGDGILDDEGGLLGTGLLADDTTTDGGIPVEVTLPIDVSGVDVSVLDGALSGTQLGGILGEDGSVLGNGVAVTADQAVATIFAAADTGDNDLLHGVVGVPIDLSGTWASLLGNLSSGGTNGVVVEPRLVTEPRSVTSGLLDSYITAPISVSCVTASIISDYLGGECAAGSTPGSDSGTSGNLLESDLLDDGVVSDNILSLDDGLLVDPFGAGSTTTVAVDAVDAVVGVPLDLSRSWVSVFGSNGGVVVVPDLTTTPSAVVGDDVLAVLPITIDCASIVILSDFERDCAAGPVDPEDPPDPTDPTVPTTPVVPEVPTVGGAHGQGATDEAPQVSGANGAPCIPVDTTAAVDEGLDLGLIGVAALAGALAAMAMMAFTRRFGASK